jgi:hypothetical protein
MFYLEKSALANCHPERVCRNVVWLDRLPEGNGLLVVKQQGVDSSSSWASPRLGLDDGVQGHRSVTGEERC